jgi:hypothetical protein
MIVTIKLTTAGSETGPFNLYSDVDGFVTVFETNVSKQKLLAGYTTNLAPENTKVVRVCSIANCKNCVDIKVSIVCENPFYKLFTDALASIVPAAPVVGPALSGDSSTFADSLNRILQKGIVNYNCKLCCPDCQNYVFGSVETSLKYAEAMGIPGGAVPPVPAIPFSESDADLPLYTNPKEVVCCVETCNERLFKKLQGYSIAPGISAIEQFKDKGLFQYSTVSGSGFICAFLDFAETNNLSTTDIANTIDLVLDNGIVISCINNSHIIASVDKFLQLVESVGIA